MKKTNQIVSWKRIIGVWITTILIFSVILALGGIGLGYDVSLTFSDAYNQYLPFHAEFRQLILTGDWHQVLYHWNLGFGSSFVGVYSYYLSSPFAWMSLLFKPDQLIHYFYLVVLLKAGLTSVSGYLFFSHQPRVNQKIAMLFSVLYALSGTMIDRFYNIMWLDVIAMLPLTLWMLQRLIHQKRWRGFCCCLIYLFWSNFYMAYIVGIFCLIWFLVELFLNSSLGRKEKWSRFFSFIGCAGLAAWVCAGLLLPTFCLIRENSYPQGVDWTSTHSVTQSLYDFYIGAYNSLKNNANGNIYLTLFGLLAGFSFGFNPLFRRKERTLFMGLSLVLLFSFSCPVMEWIWHGFKMPQGFPNRYAFLFSFLWLYLGCQSLSLAPQLTTKQKRRWLSQSIGVGMGLTILVLIAVACQPKPLETIMDVPTMVINLSWLMILSLIFYNWQLSKKTNSSWTRFLLLMIGLEVLLNGFMSVYQLSHTQYSWREDDTVTYQMIQEDLKGLNPKPYERFLFSKQPLNSSLLHRVPTVENYNTLGHRQINGLLKLLMFGSSGSNVEVVAKNDFAKTTPSFLLDSLLGLTYYHLPTLELEKVGHLSWVIPVEDKWLFNPYALPLAFSVDSGVLESPLSQLWTSHGLKNQERLLNYLLGHHIDDEDYVSFAYPWQVEVIELENLELEKASNKYMKIDLNQDSWMTLKVTSPTKTNNLKLYLSLDTNTNHEVIVGDVSSINMINGYVFASSPKEKELMVRIKMEAKDDGRFSPLQLASIDEEKIIHLLDRLRATTLEDWEMNGNLIKTAVHLEKSTCFWLNIPYSRYWTATIDGKEIPLHSVDDTFMAVELPKGQYELLLTYQVPGLKLGLIVSLLGVFATGILMWKSRPQSKDWNKREL